MKKNKNHKMVKSWKLIINSDRLLIKDFNKLSEKSFKKVWDNPEDAVYEKL
jgi:hypothetical protein